MASSTHISNEAQPILEPAATHNRAEELAKSDLWIFREGRREFSGPAFLRDLQQKLEASHNVLDGLIQAGELEAALADLQAPGTSAAAILTDALAHQLCTGSASHDAAELAKQIGVPTTIRIAPPEGFTYYALHPLDFARVAERISTAQHNSYAVIGIRSIGTTLSAVTAAALNPRGKRVNRITVRPTGHPYSRITHFSPEQQCWIAEQLARSAHFLVVDEGPGRSGSTFLSVAEALYRAGVPRQQITVIGSRLFDPESLCTTDANERWRHFKFVCTRPSMSRFENWPYIGGGDWRNHFCAGEQHWPESWTQMERFKALSPDRSRLIKFEGMGRIGNEVRQRAFVLADAGFSPAACDIEDGFLSYSLVEGTRLRVQDASSSTLERIARYCAFRASEFARPALRSSELEQMLVHNLQQEFGRELNLAPGRLIHATATLVDGRMQPYEWIVSSDGNLLKTDAISHGDDHFFPGPCSIAWDVAGTVVEWDLGQDATEFLLRRFQQYSGIDLSRDLQLCALAYCVFRLGFCKMARSTVLRTREEGRLHSAYHHYRAKALVLLDSSAIT